MPHQTVRVAALTSGRNTASARFRLREYIGPLGRLGIQVDEFIPYIDKFAPIPGVLSRIHRVPGFPLYVMWQVMKSLCRLPGVWGSLNSDVTWLQRQLLPGFLTFEPFLKKPLIFDVDDAIWMYRFWSEDAVKYTAKRATMVIAGNRYLADYFSKFAREVRIIPTAVDTARFYPKTGPTPFDIPDRFVIGWTGASSTVQYLENLEAPLSAFLAEKKDALLLIIGNQRPKFTRIPPGQLQFVPWSAARESVVLRAMNVGIMPLPDNPWTRGKCAFKMIQYMATGLPVIVSPVGVNAEILAMGDIGLGVQSDRDWYDALNELYANPDSGSRMGLNGRALIEARFSVKVMAHAMADAIRSVK